MKRSLLSTLILTPLFLLLCACNMGNTSTTSAQRLIRISQLDRQQYASEQEYEQWSASTCSTASMVEVMDAYGYRYRITDVLHAQIAAHAISPELGLLDNDGIARTVKQFGFRATIKYGIPLEQVIALVNGGTPIIVDFPPSAYFPTGHLLVVIGGDSSRVFLADSSADNITELPPPLFSRYWRGGIMALVTPQ